MALHLFDSATRSVREFTPLTPGQVGMYVCGATVQSPPHVGHLRAAVAFDVLVRWLKRSGYDVTLVRNVTDIDDKILAKAQAAGRPWWAWAYLNEQLFTAAYDALGVLRPTYEPRATGHVPEMIALMERLIERGHAYVASPGNVYFDVPSWPQYGELTHQGGGQATGEVAEEGKRDPRDFALWKAAKPGEPATAAWETPFGRGRPGWHLECSAMSTRYLGPEFDIHGGGLDLRFPHHENELAQSRAAGDPFARYWLHSAWVTQGGEKMSKSLGNGLDVASVLAQWPAAVVRVALASVHYRSMIEWGPGTLPEAAAVWNRFRGFVARAAERGQRWSEQDVAQAAIPPAAAEAFDDDVNVSAALAVASDLVREGNTALAEGRDADAGALALAVRATLDVLGLDPLSAQWDDAAASGADDALAVLVEDLLAQRAQARAEKDFGRADAIRAVLAAAGVQVEDSPIGARWQLADTSARQEK